MALAHCCASAAQRCGKIPACGCLSSELRSESSAPRRSKVDRVTPVRSNHANRPGDLCRYRSAARCCGSSLWVHFQRRAVPDFSISVLISVPDFSPSCGSAAWPPRAMPSKLTPESDMVPGSGDMGGGGPDEGFSATSCTPGMVAVPAVSTPLAMLYSSMKLASVMNRSPLPSAVRPSASTPAADVADNKVALARLVGSS